MFYCQSFSHSVEFLVASPLASLQIFGCGVRNIKNIRLSHEKKALVSKLPSFDINLYVCDLPSEVLFDTSIAAVVDCHSSSFKSTKSFVPQSLCNIISTLFLFSINDLSITYSLIHSCADDSKQKVYLVKGTALEHQTSDLSQIKNSGNQN